MKLFRRLFPSPDRRTEKRKLGDRGEEIAEEYLKNKGYRIIERNWVSGKNELDMVALNDGDVVFVEVKTTASDKAESFKRPAEAVDAEKRENIIAAAREYVIYRKRRNTKVMEGYRFDVIEVFLNRETTEINHIENAFYVEKGYKRK